MSNDHIIQFIKDVSNKIDPETGALLPNSFYEDVRLLKAISELLSTIANSSNKKSTSTIAIDEVKRKALKDFRREQAQQEDVPHFCIFSDKCLDALLCANIQRKEDLLAVNGIGEKRYKKYGDALFAIFNIDSPSDSTKKSQIAPLISTTKIESFEEDSLLVSQDITQDKKDKSCANCRFKINKTCSKLKKELCDEYERGIGFTEKEVREGYYGGNEGDASRYRRQRSKK